MNFSIYSFIYFTFYFKLIYCIDEEKVKEIVNDLASQFPQQSTNNENNVYHLKQINDIIINSTKPVSRRLAEIWDVIIPTSRTMSRKKNFSDRKVWKELEKKYSSMIDKNDLFVTRLLRSDVPESVRAFNAKILDLFDQIDVYMNGRGYLIEELTKLIRKESEDTFSQWAKLRNEIYGPQAKGAINKSMLDRTKFTENYADFFMSENLRVSPEVSNMANAQYEVYFNDSLTKEVRIDGVWHIFVEHIKEQQASRNLSDADIRKEWDNMYRFIVYKADLFDEIIKRFTEDDINSDRLINLYHEINKLRFSRALYEATKDDAMRMLEKILNKYTDEEILNWELKFFNNQESKFETSYGKRRRIIHRHVMFNHNNTADWSPKYANLTNAKFNLECDQSKTQEQRLKELKNIVTVWREQAIHIKFTHQQEEEFWENQSPVEKHKIDICDKAYKNFRDAGPRIYLLHLQIEAILTSDKFFRASIPNKLNLLNAAVDEFTDDEVFKYDAVVTKNAQLNDSFKKYA